MNDSIQTKTCVKCKLDKPLDEFYIQSGRATAMAWCKNCINNKTMSRITANRKEAIAYLGGRCTNCGFEGCPAVFDFHHRDPSEKEQGVGKLFSRSWSRIKEEIDKCNLLCANCHREEHWA
jgi:hypothetical protein